MANLEGVPSEKLNEPKLLSLEGWYYFGELLLNTTYLQPFKFTTNHSRRNVPVKNNTHNGYIEREIHGAMHAARVAWSTKMLHRLCQQQYPNTVQHKIKALLEFTKLNEEELFYLIGYVGLGHDAAREGDGADRWEKESATVIEKFLKEHGINPQLAQIVSHLASLKDKPQALTDYLASYNLSAETIEGLQYARLLISLADCFDIIRCNGSFEFSFIEEKLSDVFPYLKDKDAVAFFNYAKHVMQLLQRQKDLYFPTQLIGPNKEIVRLQEGEEDYSIHEKLKLEHADNVLVSMLDSLNQDDYFQALLNTETPSDATIYDNEPAFNPYIHGTNSSVLALMTQTDFRLMSAIEMLEQYERAPFCGELTQGGFSDAMADGKPCFGRLNGEEYSNEYSLKKIINKYAKARFKEVASKEECLDQLKRYATNPFADFFSTINVINISLARARQLGIHLKEIPEVQSLDNYFQQVIDIFYLYLLFATHIVPKKEMDYLSVRDQDTLWAQIKVHFSLEKVLNKLQDANLSIRDIYHNPSAENCQKIINLFTLPAECRVHQLFEYTNEPEKEEGQCNRRFANALDYLFRNSGVWKFEQMLFETYVGTYSRVDFQRAAPELLRYIETLEKRFHVTQKLLQEPQKPLLLSPEDSDLVEHPMPIILCYNKHAHIRIISMQEQEYRLQTSIKLGEDIQTIATDTPENLKRLQAYNERHHLNINVILFADLERACQSLKSEHPLTSVSILRQPLLTPDRCITEACNSAQPIHSDVKALNDFCTQQRVRLGNSSVLNSLNRFQEKAEKIILSNGAPIAKRNQLKACAHKEFEHRHYVPRLLADTLLLISSFALVGLVVGLARVLNGHSFFFSTEKTRREEEFIQLADTMKLIK